jgi:hypothetical protein
MPLQSSSYEMNYTNTVLMDAGAPEDDLSYFLKN